MGTDRVHDESTLAKHVVYILLPAGAVFGLMIRRWRR
jgi:hypothetical protein